MITVINFVPVYAVDGKNRQPGESISIQVCSHLNRDEMVVLTFASSTGDPIKVTVSAKELRVAIENATNTAKW